MSLSKELTELVKAEIISTETAERIRAYYDSKKGSSANKLFIVFGILGAILVGLGIILIVAHNWDELSKPIKTVFAFLPLVLGQLACVFTLLKKYHSTAWREGSSVVLFFSVGACIALISQIYNIPGNLSGYLLTWSLLCFPLMYVMKSSVSSLLYWVFITYYVCETSYWHYPSSEAYPYWLLLLLGLPYYYLLYKNSPKSNFMTFHNWIIPLSVIISLGSLAKTTEELMFVGYMSLFGILYLLGSLRFFEHQKLRNNGYKILGSLGTFVLLLILSFDWFWEDLRTDGLGEIDVFYVPEFYVALGSTALATILFLVYVKHRSIAKIKPLAPIFLLFVIAFILGFYSSITTVLINLFVLLAGILTIREGAKQDHFGILNYGLLVITALVICRFFDTNLSFVLRGILFVCVGVGFFVANYWMLKKRKTNE